MRHIGTLPAETQARAFGDVLFAQGIANQVEAEEDGSWAVWVEPEDRIAEAQSLFLKFRLNPAELKVNEVRGTAEAVRREEAKANAAWQQRFYTRARIRSSSAPYGPGPLTLLLLGLCIGISYFGKMGAADGVYEHFLIDNGGGWFSSVRDGQIWRLITPMFLHFSLMHLLGNAMWLYTLGSMIEARLGRGQLILLVVVLALCSNVSQYWMSDPNFGGFSGVNYGLFGYVWIRSRRDPMSGLFIDRQNVVLMMIWLVLCYSNLVGPIANTAHTVGLIGGLAWGWLASLKRRS